MAKKFQRMAWLLLAASQLIACNGNKSNNPVVMLESPARADSLAPRFSQRSDGKTILSWLGRDGEASVLYYSEFDGGLWSPAREASRGQNWLRNWADTPAVRLLEKQSIVAYWLVKNSGRPHAYDTLVAFSTDDGATWTEPTRLNTDGLAAEHGFVSVFDQGADIGIAWLDGRRVVAPADDPPAMQLRTATFTRAGARIGEQVLDERVCDCCQTDAVTARDRTYLVYRDRSFSEERDIALSIFNQNWSPSIKVTPDNWVIEGCPVNGPQIAAKGTALAYAWYTGAEGKPAIRVIRSLDKGVNFQETAIQGTVTPLGRVDIVMLHDARIVISWLESIGDGQAEIRAQLYDLHGRTNGHRIVATVSAGRSSGFPRMIQSGAMLLFAWTDAANQQVKTARLAVADL